MIMKAVRIGAKVRDRKVFPHPAIPDHTHVIGGHARMANSLSYPTLEAIR